jgi:hypothetical protein
MKAIVIALLALSALGQGAEKEKVSIDEFRENKVLIGLLGEPFGKVVRVSCRGIAPTEEWSAFQTATVAKPASGQTLQVWGYETGGFKGSPGEAFEHVPGIADRGFRFESTFVALKKVEAAKQTK